MLVLSARKMGDKILDTSILTRLEVEDGLGGGGGGGGEGWLVLDGEAGIISLSTCADWTTDFHT